jgi:hypothetical protein
MKSNLGRGLLGAVIGAAPGAAVVLVAQFVIKGEWQLTIGAPGMMLAVFGAIVGAVVMLNKSAER